MLGGLKGEEGWGDVRAGALKCPGSGTAASRLGLGAALADQPFVAALCRVPRCLQIAKVRNQLAYEKDGAQKAQADIAAREAAVEAERGALAQRQQEEARYAKENEAVQVGRRLLQYRC